MIRALRSRRKDCHSTLSPSRPRGAELRGLVPACLKVAAEQRAAEMGLHIRDYLAYLVSTDTGIAIPGQEGLSLGLTA